MLEYCFATMYDWIWLNVSKTTPATISMLVPPITSGIENRVFNMIGSVHTNIKYADPIAVTRDTMLSKNDWV